MGEGVTSVRDPRDHKQFRTPALAHKARCPVGVRANRYRGPGGGGGPQLRQHRRHHHRDPGAPIPPSQEPLASPRTVFSMPSPLRGRRRRQRLANCPQASGFQPLISDGLQQIQYRTGLAQFSEPATILTFGGGRSRRDAPRVWSRMGQWGCFFWPVSSAAQNVRQSDIFRK